MQEYIGGTGVQNWVERIISPGYHIQKVRELRSFTDKGRISGFRPDNVTGTSEGPGLSAPELTHPNRQSRLPQVSQVQTVNRKVEPEPVSTVPPEPDRKYMTLSVPSVPMPANTQESRVQTAADEQETERASTGNDTEAQPQVDVKKVAEKVYRLMQRDLILENERATRIGG